MQEKYGLLVFWNPSSSNLGDFVQSLAAKQFLPSVDYYCSREDLRNYTGENIKIIMNGWYMDNPQNFPPSDQIFPLYLSVHINATVYKKMTTADCISHFKTHSPIGCRDTNTRDLLASKGVDAFFSACLTLTLGLCYKRESVTDKIYMVDVLHNYYQQEQVDKSLFKLFKCIGRGRYHELAYRRKILQETFSEEILECAESLTQIETVSGIEHGLERADSFLKKLSSAKLVITSRIHCALPCLAMGTPVIFLNGERSGNNDLFTSRFGGITDFFNMVTISVRGEVYRNFNPNGKISMDNIPKNKTLHIPYQADLIKQCQEFVGHKAL